MIEFENVVKTYDNGHTAVSNLSFTAPTGKITVLVGPSGCGKTTTLRMINRLITETSGTIRLGGTATSQVDTITMRRNIGYVIQNAGLFPHRTIIDNVCTVPLLKKVEKSVARERALELLTLVGLDTSYADRYPWQLSGGQQQRVGVARALAADPPYMLMDEPFSAVDPVVRKQLQDEFLRIQAEMAKTIVMVTHDIDEALRLGDQIVVLREGGNLAQIGSPEELLAQPANEFVAGFLGESRGYHALSFVNLDSARVRAVESVRIGEALRTKAGWAVVSNANGDVIGWVNADRQQGPVKLHDVHWSSAVNLKEANLRHALDAALASPNREAIVVDEFGALHGAVAVNDIIQMSESRGH